MMKRSVAAAICTGALAALCAGTALGASAPASLSPDQIDVAVRCCEDYLDPAGTLLANAHRNLGITCSTCHDPATAMAADGTPYAPGTRGFCMRSGCHDDWDGIVAATSGWTGTVTVYNRTGIYNPHDNHRGDADCGDCHKVHEQQDLTCVTCHNMEVPAGWKGYR